MQEIINKLNQYLINSLNIPVYPKSWEKSRGLPQYLRECYRFFGVDLLGTECVLMVDIAETEPTPATVRKHLEQIQTKQDVAVVYVRHSLASYNRKRLIDHQVPFIIPGNQIYLPILGIDFRRHLKKIKVKKSVFSPATQVLILHILWRKQYNPLTPAETASRLGYSAMSMTRAFDELQMAGIGEHSVSGKKRHLHFPENGQTLWEKVLPFLNTPVKKRLMVTTLLPFENGFIAGQSALAGYSALSEPKISVFAFIANDWKREAIQKNAIEIPAPEPTGTEIELWKYDPGLFAVEGKVDRLSLFLSLKDHGDERIQSALDTLLKGIEW